MVPFNDTLQCATDKEADDALRNQKEQWAKCMRYFTRLHCVGTYTNNQTNAVVRIAAAVMDWTALDVPFCQFRVVVKGYLGGQGKTVTCRPDVMVQGPPNEKGQRLPLFLVDVDTTERSPVELRSTYHIVMQENPSIRAVLSVYIPEDGFSKTPSVVLWTRAGEGQPITLAHACAAPRYGTVPFQWEAAMLHGLPSVRVWDDLIASAGIVSIPASVLLPSTESRDIPPLDLDVIRIASAFERDVPPHRGRWADDSDDEDEESDKEMGALTCKEDDDDDICLSCGS